MTNRLYFDNISNAVVKTDLCGGVAQLARALGSYPGCHWFESSRRYHFYLCGSLAQLGEHLPYKQGVTGSSPVTPTKFGQVVQLVRMPACHAGGRQFEPDLGRHF